jgi:nucleoside-diphosphate-sugar epimerase
MLIHDRTAPADPARVVVLGSRGFIGSALLAALGRAGVTAMGVGRAELDLVSDGASERLANFLRDDDAVVVLSAITPDKGRGLEPFLQNIRMGASVCRALEKRPPAHLVYVSSDAVYPMGIGLITEQSCAQPSDLYGMMHLAREVMLAGATRAPVAILRPTLVYGAPDTHNSYGPNRLRRQAHKERRITLFGEGEEMRDHIFIDDVAALLLLTLRHRSAGVLNLATGRSISYAELAGKVAACFDGAVQIIGTPRQSLVTHRHFDVAALRRAFPEFRLTPLEEGLAGAHRGMLEAG